MAEDPADPNAIWITEVWDSEASHQASLKLPAVQAAISKARPMITGFGERFVTTVTDSKLGDRELLGIPDSKICD